MYGFDRPGAAARQLARTLGIALGFATLLATGQTVPNTVVAGGGGTVSAGPFRLSSSIGEPVAGAIESGSTRVTTGFLATFVEAGEPGAVDAIFSNGFEN